MPGPAGGTCTGRSGCAQPPVRAAAGEYLTERPDLLGGDTQTVGILDQYLLHHVRTVEAGVRGEPGGGVVGLLLLVHRTIDRDEVGRVVREPQRQSGRPLRRALAPGVGQGHDVVDLHGLAGLPSAAELDQVTGVGVGQRASDHHAAGHRVEPDRGQPGAEHIVAGVAAVTVHVRPRGSEEVSLVVRQVERGDDRQSGQQRPGLFQPAGGHRPGRRVAHVLPPLRHQHRHGQRQGSGHHRGGDRAHRWMFGHESQDPDWSGMGVTGVGAGCGEVVTHPGPPVHSAGGLRVIFPSMSG